MFKINQDIAEIIILLLFALSLTVVAAFAGIYMNNTLEQECVLKKGIFSRSIDFRYSQCQLPNPSIDNK
jgi:hypothetical protein